MRELTVTLSTVTPLLLRGEDGRTPELRAPSFRGAMRYWLRATLGGVIGDGNLEGLHKLEGAVFGSPELGSAVSVRLTSLDTLRSERAYILPHKNGGKARCDALSGDMELVLSATRPVSPITWDAASANLQLALTLGGIGLRSRRCYGTLRIAKAPQSGLAVFPKTLGGWESQVAKVVGLAIAAAMGLADAHKVPRAKLPAGPAAYPCATRSGLIRLCDLQVESAMKAMMAFMNRVPENVALGGIRPRRQASPLWVRPIQTGPSKYGLLCTVLASDFPGANYGFVKEFLDDFSGKYLSVKGWNA